MRFLDLAVILAYLAGITWFGARFRTRPEEPARLFSGRPHGALVGHRAFHRLGRNQHADDCRHAGAGFRRQPGFPADGARISAGAHRDFALLFLPHYFRGEMFTAYELMRRRFGERIRKLTAAIFLVTRALAEGVRVFAVSLVISIVLGTGEVASIVLIVVLTLFYTFEGGMTAVIWTDVVQMSLYVVGAVLSFFVILGKIPGGWAHVVGGGRRGPQVRRFSISVSRPPWNSSRAPTRSGRAWSGGCFLTTASHGTDQLMVQRLLSARNERAEPRGAAGKLGGDLRSVHAVSADRRAALGLLRRPGAWPRRRSWTASIRSSSGTICRRGWRGWRWRPFWRRPWRI